MAEKAEKEDQKPIIAVILSIIPGLGHFYIESQYALYYFLGWAALCIVSFVLTIFTIFICSPIWIAPLAWTAISAVDVYMEAIEEPEKRIMKKYIK